MRLHNFPPTRLADALRHQQARQSYKDRNNEMVVDLRSIISRLPSSIEAFFLRPSSTEEEEQKVRDAHRAFLMEYGLEPTTGPPVVVLDLSDAGGNHPFASQAVQATIAS